MRGPHLVCMHRGRTPWLLDEVGVCVRTGGNLYSSCVRFPRGKSPRVLREVLRLVCYARVTARWLCRRLNAVGPEFEMPPTSLSVARMRRLGCQVAAFGFACWFVSGAALEKTMAPTAREVPRVASRAMFRLDSCLTGNGMYIRAGTQPAAQTRELASGPGGCTGAEISHVISMMPPVYIPTN